MRVVKVPVSGGVPGHVGANTAGHLRGEVPGVLGRVMRRSPIHSGPLLPPARACRGGWWPARHVLSDAGP